MKPASADRHRDGLILNKRRARRLYFMTYKCPHCGTALIPADDGSARLFCWPCGDFWEPTGGGRLRRTRQEATMADEQRAVDGAEEERDVRFGLGYDRGLA